MRRMSCDRTGLAHTSEIQRKDNATKTAVLGTHRDDALQVIAIRRSTKELGKHLQPPDNDM